MSPGPISTRVPSWVSKNQRPASGTTHCGFGLSCHSPTQPFGSTLNFTASTSPGQSRIHCGAAPPPTLSKAKPVMVQRSRRLVPSGPVHMWKKGMTGGRPSSRPSLPGLAGFRGASVFASGIEAVSRLGVVKQARWSDDVLRAEPNDDAIGYAQSVGDDGQGRVEGSNGWKEASIRHVHIVEIMDFAVAVEDRSRGILAEPKRSRLVRRPTDRRVAAKIERPIEE